MKMYFHAILFVFLSCQLYPYHKSSVDCLKNNDDSVLTQDTIEVINNQFNEQSEDTKKRIRNLMKAKKRIDAEKIQQAKLEASKAWQEATKARQEATKGWQEATRFQLESKKLQRETFYQLFSCAVSTIKAFMNNKKDERILWKKINISSLDISDQISSKLITFPPYIVDLITKYDGPAPFGATILQHLDYHMKRFFSLYIRLKRDKYEKSNYFEKLRTLIKQEYKPENDEKTDEVYQQFAATITRDNNFFAGQYHTQLGEVLHNILFAKSPREQDVLDNILKINPNWYLDETHIKNINILMMAYSEGKNLPKIFGYKCKNGVGQDIEIPLSDDCGYRRDFTYRPEKLKLT